MDDLPATQVLECTQVLDTTQILGGEAGGLFVVSRLMVGDNRIGHVVTLGARC